MPSWSPSQRCRNVHWGRQSGGEGFVGFAQAFFLAGSRSLILSLWEVDDRATSLLMRRFLRRTGWGSGLA